MEKDVYSEFLDLEQNHWWFIGRRKIFFTLLDQFFNKKEDIKILDVGCGPGEMVQPLSKYGKVFALDFSTDALESCMGRGYRLLINGDATTLPLKAGTFDLISLFDTIEHIDNDTGALRECYRLLADDGLIIVTLPAYNFLFSNNDRAAHHKRRYTTSEIRRKVRNAGFRVRKLTYINTWLFPVIFFALFFIKLKEALFPVKNPDKTNISFPVPKIVHTVLAKIFSSESCLLKRISFPFGHSLVCIAEKTDGFPLSRE